jgi:sulfite reductase (NADPH) hemoprotein beta-component
VPARDLLPYVEAIVSVYNRLGRRDNKYKARIKITVHETGLDEIRAMIEERFGELRPLFDGSAMDALARIEAQFAPPAWRPSSQLPPVLDPALAAWIGANVAPHRRDDHAIVTVSLKAHGATPGDATADQMRLLADLAERHAYGELRISHEQNVILPHVRRADLPAIHAALRAAGLGTANVGLASDIIACPGMDYCALATARSIPVAQGIATALRDREAEIGALKIKISGCINACGHHHVGHIGILGLDRAGVENYQITLGGDGSETLTIGERTGPGFAYDQVVPAVERLLAAYLELREGPAETFLQAYRRVGPAPFKAALYPEEKARAA